MEIVIISPNYGTHIVLIDDEDFERVSDFKWRLLKKASGGFYVQAWTKQIKGKRKIIRLHQFIIGFKFVDHINGDGLDNRKCNLRKANHQKNSFNRKKSKGKSCYKGVICVKNKWGARLTLNNKQIWLGTFNTEIEAAKAYNVGALKYFGEFAKINNLTGGELSDILQ